MCFSLSAFAHFQLIHTETSDITGKSSVPFELVFTHPVKVLKDTAWTSVKMKKEQ